jgi:enamine deaminase RidA (YjgF/YER057c/UK114 family)
MNRTLVFAALLLAIVASRSWAADRQAVNPKDFKPHGRPYSPAIKAGNMLYISGQGSQNSDGKLSESFEERVRQCLLTFAPFSRQWYGSPTWFLYIFTCRFGHVRPMNKIYWQAMGDNPRARTVLGVAALPGGNTIESMPSRLPTQE